MSPQESSRLRAYEMAKRFSPTQAKKLPSRRSSKAKRNATGQEGLKSFRIVSQRIRYIKYEKPL